MKPGFPGFFIGKVLVTVHIIHRYFVQSHFSIPSLGELIPNFGRLQEASLYNIGFPYVMLLFLSKSNKVKILNW
jgi:hypothetical protein